MTVLISRLWVKRLSGSSLRLSRFPVHRDIKPSNILMVDAGGKLVAKLADFGISKQLSDGQNTTTTAPMGSRCWAAPEVISALIDGRNATLVSVKWKTGWIFLLLTLKLKLQLSICVCLVTGDAMQEYFYLDICTARIFQKKTSVGCEQWDAKKLHEFKWKIAKMNEIRY